MKRVFAIASALALAAFGIFGQAAPAAASVTQAVKCGDTITMSIALGNDLVDCPNNGIVIGADNITVDLNGHRVDGNVALIDPCPEKELCDVGINNTLGHSGVTVKNGSIDEFAVGFMDFDGNNNLIRHLDISKSQFVGAIVAGANDVKIERNSFHDDGLNTPQGAVAAFAAQRLSIEHNRARNTGEVSFSMESSNHARVIDNRISGALAGIALAGSNGLLSRNHVFGGGILAAGDSNLISRNSVANPAACPDGCGIGISFEGGNNNVIERNFVTGSPVLGIRVDTFGGQADHNTIRKNFVRATGRDGIGIGTENADSVTSTLVKGNIVTQSTDDGIDVEVASTRLKDNLLVHNRDLGIEAVPGVIDGGGNLAAGNGNALQCTNVRCTPLHY
jgi:parallel beta-helix repeat protein